MSPKKSHMKWTPLAPGTICHHQIAESFLPSAELKNTTLHGCHAGHANSATSFDFKPNSEGRIPFQGGRGIRCQGYIQQSFPKKSCWGVKWIYVPSKYESNWKCFQFLGGDKFVHLIILQKLGRMMGFCLFLHAGLSYMEIWAVIKVMINDGFFVFSSNTGVYFRPGILTIPQE